MPIERGGGRAALQPLHEALDENAILILFAEGSRGSPDEKMEPFKAGVYLLLAKREQQRVPVYSVGVQGLGYVFGKG